MTPKEIAEKYVYGKHDALTDKQEIEDMIKDIDECIKGQLPLDCVSNCANKIERPSPYKWIKEEKFKIPDGTSYREPKVNLMQCANWISEYVKKHCC